MNNYSIGKSTGFLLLCLSLLSSCAGYRLVGKDNPFSQYDIKTVSVPMFINHSNLAGLSSPFTKEFMAVLFDMSGLQIVNQQAKADALLVGVIDSPKFRRKTLSPTGLRLANGVAPNSVDERQDFYVPGSTQVNLSLRVVIIKKPSAEEIEFLRSDLGAKAVPGDKLIFNEVFNVSSSYNRVIFDGESGSVNNTQNTGVLRQNIVKMAEQSARNFRDMVLYAF